MTMPPPPGQNPYGQTPYGQPRNAYSEASGPRHRSKVVLCLEDIKKEIR